MSDLAMRPACRRTGASQAEQESVA